MTIPLLIIAALAAWMLWPRTKSSSTTPQNSPQSSPRSAPARHIWYASGLDPLRPITTQANAVKAYRMMLEQCGYARNAPGHLNGAVCDFRGELQHHLRELASTIAAYREELTNLREIIGDWECDLEGGEDAPAGKPLVPERLLQHKARAERLKRELSALQDERLDLRKDLAELVAAKANHTLFQHPDPIKLQRDESPYG